jgi:hypothetical protein
MSLFCEQFTKHPKRDIAERQCLFFVRSSQSTPKETSPKGNVSFCEGSFFRMLLGCDPCMIPFQVRSGRQSGC